MFGLFGKKEYPVLKPEMITPTDVLITTTLAKQTYRKYMAQIGFLKKDELSPLPLLNFLEIRMEIHEQLRPMAVPIDSVTEDAENVMRHPERNQDAFINSLSLYGQRRPITFIYGGRTR